ncbi:MAG TPA: GxxExxY protein [Patescibacteria group bacterium]|nr:GxxExxY protein [Patescibacteria group bacterium]
MPNIVYPELSYKLMGILFQIHTELGNRYQEKYYQRAIELSLKKNGIIYKKELPVDLIFEGEKIGKYYLDFLVENKIILEVKAVERILPKDFTQLLAYLKANNLELGILVNFRTNKLFSRRILNSDFQRDNSGHLE